MSSHRGELNEKVCVRSFEVWLFAGTACTGLCLGRWGAGSCVLAKGRAGLSKCWQGTGFRGSAPRGTRVSHHPTGEMFLELFKTRLPANAVEPEQWGGASASRGAAAPTTFPSLSCEEFPRRWGLPDQTSHVGSFWASSPAESLQTGVFAVELFLSCWISKSLSSKVGSSYESTV